jgi:hypothetical protein
MAFLLAEGFGNVKDGTHTAGVDRQILGDQWASYGANFAIEDIGDGRKWMKTPSTSDVQVNLQTTGWTGVSTIALCIRVLRSAHEDTGLWEIKDGSTIMCTVAINSSGQVVVAKTTGFGGAGILTSSAIPLDTETHIEVRLVLHNTTGAAYIYFNGVLDCSVTGVDTIYNLGSVCTNVYMFGQYNWDLPNTTKWTDMIVHTEASPLGDTGVYYLQTDAAGTDADFTPSAGSNYQNVDEVGPDEDTTYNESDGTAGHRDSFNCEAISGVTVLAVGTLVRARKTDVGDASLLLGAVYSGSETQSAAKALTEQYLTKMTF